MALLSTDPLDVAMDADGDIDMTNGLTLVRGEAGVAQLIDIAISVATEEWFLNLDYGVDWAKILGEKFSDPLQRQRLVKAISGVPGVVGTISLAISFDNATRKTSVAWSVLAQFGDVVTGTTLVGGSNG